jgi:hypothetical protein
MRHKDLDSNAELDALSDQALIDGLLPASAGEPHPIDSWLQDVGYVPGTTRISATQLYAEYKSWFHCQHELANEKPCNIVWFGRYMAKRFKQTRKSAGVFYYLGKITPEKTLQEK